MISFPYSLLSIHYSLFFPHSDIIARMTLTLAEVEHIAQLARLDLTPEELESYRKQLSDILDYAQRLQTVDTRQIPPTSSSLSAGSRLPARSVLREDVPAESLPVQKILSNAPQTEDHQFRVPPVME
jgi:aspartyl-tRNA(Asn)/glutamyl-tRNA(Gln) amidotransferase subunit C